MIKYCNGTKDTLSLHTNGITHSSLRLTSVNLAITAANLLYNNLALSCEKSLRNLSFTYKKAYGT